MRNFKNPESFFARFVVHFALGYSACLVAAAVALLAHWTDLSTAAIWCLGFATLFGLIRAAIAKPNTPFWGSPAMNSK